MGDIQAGDANSGHSREIQGGRHPPTLPTHADGYLKPTPVRFDNRSWVRASLFERIGAA